MRKSFTTKYSYGDEIALKSAPEVKRVVSGFLLRPRNVTVGSTAGNDESWNQECEIQKWEPQKKNAWSFNVGGFKG